VLARQSWQCKGKRLSSVGKAELAMQGKKAVKWWQGRVPNMTIEESKHPTIFVVAPNGSVARIGTECSLSAKYHLDLTCDHCQCNSSIVEIIFWISNIDPDIGN